jgi:hypothetical protein
MRRMRGARCANAIHIASAILVGCDCGSGTRAVHTGVDAIRTGDARLLSGTARRSRRDRIGAPLVRCMSPEMWHFVTFASQRLLKQDRTNRRAVG